LVYWPRHHRLLGIARLTSRLAARGRTFLGFAGFTTGGASALAGVTGFAIA
jgi:hypothetical protein